MSGEKTRKLDTLAKLFQAVRCRTRRVTSLGHQEGEGFWEGPKFFIPCPIILNYVQHIFTRGANRTPWLRAWVELLLGKTIGQLTKVRTPRRL